MDNTETTSGTPFATGQVSLPNDGQVLSVDTPAAGSTNDPNAAASTPATQVAPPAQNKPAQAQAQQPSGAPQVGAQQPGAPQGPNAQGQPPAAPKQNTPAAAPAAPPQEDLSQHPMVKAAGVTSAVARALAGNPQTVTIDPMTGEEKHTPAPITGKQIALAIAAQALAGAAAGAGAKPGPGVLGRAAAAGTAAGLETQQARQGKAEAISQQDYNRKLQIAHTNMLMYNNARNMGEKDADDIDKYINSYAPLADRLIKGEVPGYKGIASHDELAKYNAVGDTGIPYERVARMGTDGKQVEVNGRPVWDMKYLIYDPTQAKASGMISPDAVAWGKKIHMQGMDNPLIDDTPTSGVFAANRNAALLNASLAAKDIEDNYVTTLNNDKSGTYAGLKAPTFDDPAVQSYVDNADNIYTNVPKEVIAGIIQQETGGVNKDGPVDPKSGQSPIGLMQIMPATGQDMINPATGKGYTVEELHDPATNVQAGTQYFAQKLQENGGDLTKALIAYHGGGAGSADVLGKTSGQYAKDIGNIIGLSGQNSLPASTPDKFEAPNWETLAGKDGSALNNTLNAFQAHLAGTYTATGTYSYSKAINSMLGDKDALVRAQGSQMLGILGGNKNVLRYDQSKHLDSQAATEQQKLNQVTENKLSTAQQQQAVTEQNAHKYFDFHNADGSPVDLNKIEVTPEMMNMSEKELENYYTSKGIKVPPTFTSAYEVAHNAAKFRDVFNARIWKSMNMSEADAQQAMIPIVKAINPNWTEGDYDQAQTYRNELGSTKPNTAGGNLASINFAAAHLSQLNDLAVALDQKNNHSNVQPLNDWMNRWGTTFGATPAMSDQAIATAVGQEVARGVAGSKPDEDVVHSYINSLAAKNALPQTQAILNGYEHLLYARAKVYDDKSQKLLGKHIDNFVAPETNQLFQKNGWDTPWTKTNSGQNAGTQQQQNSNLPQKPDITKLSRPQGAAGIALSRADNQWHWADNTGKDYGVAK